MGSALIRWRLEECWHDGHELVMFLGHPRYYPRFGFVPAMTLNVCPPFEAASEAFLLLELRPGVFAGRGGTVRYPPEFDAL